MRGKCFSSQQHQGHRSAKCSYGWWQENDIQPCLTPIWTTHWKTKAVFFPSLTTPWFLLFASKCNLSPDLEPSVQIRDCWLRFSSEIWAKPCWWASTAEAGLLPAKRKIMCQPGVWLFFITNFLICLFLFPSFFLTEPLFSSFYMAP